MKRTYRIAVDCANCANLCESAANKVSGVSSATIVFMTQKMVVDFEESADIQSVLQAICKACRKIDPDFEIVL